MHRFVVLSLLLTRTEIVEDSHMSIVRQRRRQTDDDRNNRSNSAPRCSLPTNQFYRGTSRRRHLALP